MLKITVLFDSDVSQTSKKASMLGGEWGLSLYIEFEGKHILFDTGANGRMLMNNMTALGIKPGSINLVFISHNHNDHLGGLLELSNFIRRDIPIIILPGYSTETNFVAKTHGMFLEVKRKEVFEIAENVYTTGMLGTRTNEQSIFLKTKKGIVVVVGCSHPGIKNIIDVAKTLGNVYAVIGGFHNWYKNDKDLDAFDGIEKIYPIHCSIKRDKLVGKFGRKVNIPKVGDVIKI